MEKEDYQANWRGARRYQFDEETRLKKLAMQSRDGVVKFRRVKWADPEQKLKVLVEDLHQVPEQRDWLDRRVEWPEPEAKVKSLVEDDLHRDNKPKAWLERMPAKSFWLLTCIAGAIAFCIAALLAYE
jgi:hypothetical protein